MEKDKNTTLKILEALNNELKIREKLTENMKDSLEKIKKEINDKNGLDEKDREKEKNMMKLVVN